MVWNDPNLIKVLQNDGIAVMPTDTIYGLVGKALSPYVVERVYAVRKRAPQKPFIILIGDISDLEKFSIKLTEEEKSKLLDLWLSPKSTDSGEATSVVLDCEDSKLEYLHRGLYSLAFRLPKEVELQNLLSQTGPLIAPSANPEGLTPAENAVAAEKYFGNTVDYYADGGNLAGKASKVIKLRKDGSTSILRE